MERDCEDCGVAFKDDRHFKGELPKSAFCPLCCSERFYADMDHTSKSQKEETWNFRSSWKARVFNTSSLYEEGSDFLHIKIDKGEMKLEIAVKKREGFDDEFLVWIGDKQFLCKSEAKDPGAKHEQGKVLSEHSPLDILDEGI